MKAITIERKVRFGRRPKDQPAQPPGAAVDTPRVPRVARLMALAIRFDVLIRTGQVADYAELARLGHVTRARLTQIMNLLNLAPDIQEALLFAEQDGRAAVSERGLRAVAAELDWRRQRRLRGQCVTRRC